MCGAVCVVQPARASYRGARFARASVAPATTDGARAPQETKKEKRERERERERETKKEKREREGEEEREGEAQP